MKVEKGSLLYWKQSYPEYTWFGKGHVFEVEANEEYGFVALEDFENYVSFSPRITLPD
jgi:hypothetical protein